MKLNGKINIRFRILLDKLIDNNISPAEFKEMRGIIKTIPEARNYYVNYVKLHVMLKKYYNKKNEIEKSKNRILILKQKPRNFKPMALAAAGFLFIIGSIFYWNLSNISHEAPPPTHTTKRTVSTEKLNFSTYAAERKSEVKACITKMKNIKLVAGNTSLKTGSYLKKGNLLIKSGVIEITFNSGAITTIEAPADFKIADNNIAALYKGKLTAYVPEEASGFTLETPSLVIKDIGTMFGVNTINNFNSEIIVKEGIVNVSLNHKNKYISTNIISGKAINVSLKSNNPFKRIKYDEEEYVFSTPKKSANINFNYIHWSFNDIENRFFTDTGTGINNKKYIAELKNKAPLQNYLINGKFEKALKYTNKSMLIETDFPGIEGSNPRSILFWVKFPKISQDAIDIVSWGNQKNGQRWHIRYSSRGQLAIKAKGPGSAGTYEGEGRLNDDLWHHIAVIFTGGKNADLSTHTKIYIDGKLDNVLRSQPCLINSSINNKMVIGKIIKDRKQVRPTSFTIDEFYIFDGALTQIDIKNILKYNNP